MQPWRRRWLRLREKTAQIWDWVTKRGDIEKFLGVDISLVRLSLGLVTNFADVWRVERFVRSFAE